MILKQNNIKRRYRVALIKLTQKCQIHLSIMSMNFSILKYDKRIRKFQTPCSIELTKTLRNNQIAYYPTRGLQIRLIYTVLWSLTGRRRWNVSFLLGFLTACTVKWHHRGHHGYSVLTKVLTSWSSAPLHYLCNSTDQTLTCRKTTVPYENFSPLSKHLIYKLVIVLKNLHDHSICIHCIGFVHKW